MVNVQISVGELIDKLSILFIKTIKINDETKLAFIRLEYEHLFKIAKEYLNDPTILLLYMDLIEINLLLWNVEDELRKQEKNQEFGDLFIENARNVYHSNDLRFNLKNKINEYLNSGIREVKDYVDYKPKTTDNG